MPKGILCFLAALLVTITTKATIVTSVANGDWDQSGTWDLGVPGVGDTALITDFDVTVDQAHTCLALMVQANANSDTYLYINTGGTLTVTTFVTVSALNENRNVFLQINGTGILNAADVNYNRDAANTTVRQLNFQVNGNGVANISNNFNYNYLGGGNEGGLEINLNGSGRINLTNDLNLTLSSGITDLNVDINDDGYFDINGDLNVNHSGADDFLFYMDSSGTLDVLGSINIDQDGGDDIFFDLNIFGGTDASLIVGADFILDKDGGDDFFMRIGVNGSGASISMDDLKTNTLADSDNDAVQFDLNNGTITVSDSAVFENHDGFRVFTYLFLDEVAFNTNYLYVFNDANVDRSDIIIDLASSSNASKTTLNVTNNLYYNFDDGRTGELEVNDSATVTVGDTFIVEVGDILGQVSIDVNTGGNLSVSGPLNYTIENTAPTTADIDMRIDGANLTVGDGVNLLQNGGDDVAVYFNLGGTANPTIVDVTGSFNITHTGGDNIDLRKLGNATIKISDDLDVRMSNSADADAIRLDLDGDSVLVGDSTIIQLGSGNTSTSSVGVNMDSIYFSTTTLYLDHSGGVGNADYNFNINAASQVNPSTLIISEDIRLIHSGSNRGMNFGVRDNVTLNVTGDIIWSNTNAAGGDDAFSIRSSNTDINIGDDLIYTVSGGGTGENLTVDMDGSCSVNVTGDVRINQVTGGNTVFYMNRTVQPINGAKFIIGDSLIIDHEAAAGDFTFDMRAQGDSCKLMTNTIYVDHVPTGGDFVRFIMNNPLDTIMVTNNVTMSMNTSGAVGTDDYLFMDVNDGFLSVGGNLEMQAASGDEVILDILNATASIGGDLSLGATGGFVRYDSDGSDVTVGQDMVLSNSSVNQDILFIVDNNSTLTIADSLFIDFNSGDDLAMNLGNTTPSYGKVRVGGDFVIDHETAANIMTITLNDASLLDVGNNFHLLHDAAGGDYMSFIMNGSVDTLLVGGAMKWNQTSGATASDDDLRLDMNGGYLKVKDSLVFRTVGDDITFDVDGGVLVDSSHVLMLAENADDIDFDLNNPSTLITGNLNISNLNGDRTEMDIIGTTHTVEGDINITMNSNTGIYYWNQDISTVNVGNDFIYTNDGTTTSQFYFDNNSNLNVSDSLFLDLNTQSGNALFYIDNASLGTRSRVDVNHFLIDHETTASPVYVNLFNNSTLDVTNDLTILQSATGGDFVEMETNAAGDSLLIGGDLSIQMDAGTAGVTDDIRIYFYNGYVSIGDSLFAHISSGNDITFINTAATTSVGSKMILYEDNGDDIAIDVNGGTIDVMDDFIVDLNNSDAIVWDQDGGVVTIGADLIYKATASTGNSIVYLDNGSRWNISDSLLLDLEGNNLTQFFLDDGTGTESQVNIGNDFVIDHEVNAGYVDMRLEGNSDLFIADNFHVYHDANGADFVRLEIFDANDTVTVGGEMRWEMTTGGAVDAGDDFALNMDGGYLKVSDSLVFRQLAGDDIIVDIDGGVLVDSSHVLMQSQNADDIDFDLNNTSTLITGNLNIKNTNGQRCEMDIAGGVHTIEGDININVNNITGNYFWNQDNSTVDAQNDFIFTTDGNVNSYFYFDNNSTFNLGDSLFLDLNTQSAPVYMYLDNANLGVRSRVDMGHLYIDHETTAGDVYVNLFNNSTLDITNDLHVDHSANGGDFLEIETNASGDSLLIGGDLDVSIDGGVVGTDDDIRLNFFNGIVSVGDSLHVMSLGCDDIGMINTAATTTVGSKMIFDIDSSDDILIDVNGGSVSVTDDVILETSNSDAITWDQDGGITNVGQDMIFNATTSTGTVNLLLDNSSTVDIVDSLLFDVSGNNVTRIYLDDAATTESQLAIGNDFVINHGVNASDVDIRLEGNSDLFIADDFHVYHDADGGDYVRLEMYDANDTVLVGGEMKWLMTSGSAFTEDDLRLNMDGGYLKVKDSLVFRATAGDGITVDLDGGVFVDSLHVLMYSQDADDIDFDLNNTSTLITGNLNITNVNGDRNEMDIAGGTHTVEGDVHIHVTNTTGNYSWNQDNSTVNVLNDFTYRTDGNVNSYLYFDANSRLNVTDSIFLDLNTQTAPTYFYTDASNLGSRSRVDVSHFFIDHEPTAHDVFLNLFNNSTLDVTNDINIDHSAGGGDIIEVETNATSDSLIIGGDLDVLMDAGAFNTDDDVRIRFLNGIVSIGDSLYVHATSGDDIGTLNGAATTTIGSRMIHDLSNAGDIYIDINGGLLDVTDDIQTKMNSGALMYWDQDGGTVNAMSDFTYQTDGNVNSQFYFDNNSRLNVTDSLFLDLNAQTGAMTFYQDLGNQGTRSRVDVAHFYIDHEAAAHDAYVNLFNNSTLDIANNLLVHHSANGGDFVEIETNGASDSLLIGGDLKVLMDAGTAGTDDDVRINFLNGVVSIGDSLYVDASAGDDIGFLSNAASTTIASRMVYNLTNADDILIDINGGDITVTEDIEINMNAGDFTSWDQDGGTVTTAQDFYINAIAASNSSQVLLDNASTLVVTDSMFFNIDQNITTLLYLNDAGGTGAHLSVNELVFDHETLGGDVDVRLEGDAGLFIANDFDVYHAADGGDYFRLEIYDSADSLTIGGAFNGFLENGTAATDDDFRFNMDGGYFNVVGNFNVTATDGDDILFDKDGGKFNARQNLSFTSTNANNVIYSVGGDSTTVHGNLDLSSDAGATGTVQHQLVSGINRVLGTTDMSSSNSANNQGDVFIDVINGTNDFSGKVILNSTNNSDNAEIEVDAGITTLQDELEINVNTNADGVIFDHNGGILTVTEDITVNHNTALGFSIDMDGGVFNALQDFYYHGDGVTTVYNYFDGGPTFNVSDSLFYNLDNTGLFRFWMEDGAGTGAAANVNHFYIDHETASGDVDMRLEGDATLNVTNDLFFDHEGSGGDFVEIQLTDVLDSLIVGGSVIIDHNSGNNGNDNIILDLNDGVMSVTDDVYLGLASGGDINCQLDGSHRMIVGDSLIFDQDGGDELFFYLNQNSGTNAQVVANTILFDLEDIDERYITLNGGDSKIETTGNFTFDNGIAGTNDLTRILMNDAGNTDSIIVGGVFTAIYNNSNLTNGNSDFRFDQNGGHFQTGGNAVFQFDSGNDYEITVDADNASWLIGGDLIFDANGGDDFYLRTGLTAGSPNMTVNGDLTFDYSGGDFIELELNNSSTFNVVGDVNFTVAADDQAFIDLNGTSRFRIGGNFQRGGSLLGELDSEVGATVEYNGALGSQNIAQDAGFGTDFFNYGGLHINNTFGTSPQVLQVAPTTVNGTLTLEDGVVATGADTLVCTSTVAADITAHSNASFIFGTLRKSIVSNADTYPLPVGKGNASTDYHLAELVNGNLTGPSFVTASVASITEVAPNNDANLNLTKTQQDGTQLIDVLETAEWDIVPNNVVTGGSFGINLYVENVSGLSAAFDDAFTVMKRNSSSTTYDDWDTFEATTSIPAPGGPGRVYNTGNGFARRTGYTSFSKFAIAVSNGSPLPIELLSFDAQLVGKEVALTWTTLTEINNDFFTIERSSDAQNFEEIIYREGAGNSTVRLDYMEYDRSPNLGINYYRLKQTDFNGAYTYSQIEAVEVTEIDAEELQVSIFPNPSNGENISIRLFHLLPSESVQFDLYDFLGTPIYSNRHKANENGDLTLTLDLNKKLARGSYLLNVRTKDKTIQEKLIVK